MPEISLIIKNPKWLMSSTFSIYSLHNIEHRLTDWKEHSSKILSTWEESICVVLYVYVCANECLCVSLPVSGCILNAGTVESLCMKPYVTLPLEPSSASTAWTCRTNVPAGWFSRTDVLSRYCWHWEWVRQGGQVGGREDHRSGSVKKLRSIRHSIQTVSKSVWEVKCWKDRFKITTVVFYWGDKKCNVENNHRKWEACAQQVFFF